MTVSVIFLRAALDGMPVENGRFVGGPATVLALSGDQVRSLEASRELTLSGEQRDVLRRASGAAPLRLLVYDTRKGENDCTCDARNRGLRFSADQVDVPHAYLVSESVRPWPWLPALGLLVLVTLGSWIVRGRGRGA